MKFLERIPLERFAYLNVEADTFAELVETVKKVKEVYKDRLHKENDPGASSQATAPFGNSLPPKEAQACQDCGSVMVWKTGFSKKNGKKWQAWMCPNSKPGVDGHPPVWVK